MPYHRVPSQSGQRGPGPSSSGATEPEPIDLPCHPPDGVVALPGLIGDMNRARLSKAEARILAQYWKLGTCSVPEILDSLPPEERVAYTTVQTLVYRLEAKGAGRKVRKIATAQLFHPATAHTDTRTRSRHNILTPHACSPHR